MKKKNIAIYGVMALMTVLLTCSICVISISRTNNEKESKERKVTIETFSAWTECEVFQEVPSLVGKDTKVGEAVDYGNKHYIIDVNGVKLEEYREYLTTLETAGFVKHSDNGETGMDGYVYTASLQKDNLTLTVSYIAREEKTYISGAYDLELSEHLIYKDEYKKGISESAKTSVHMLELNDNGNSFVIQLKNGHFLVHDGGNKEDAIYLLDYLESLTPKGQKPIIEAWFISHAHTDHYGAIWEISSNVSMQNRLIVNGIYFSEPNVNAVEWEGDVSQDVIKCRLVAKAFKTEKGELTSLYRPQIGQRYYFCDVIIDIPLTAEQFPHDSYDSTDLNDTSVWLMHYIDGQKFLLSGDTNKIGIKKAMTIFDTDYFDLDVMAVFHHGINVYDYFTEYTNVDTLLYTSFRAGSIWTDGTWKEAKEANVNLQNAVKEYYHRGDGTVVLTFPYKVGEAKVLEPCDWRYNTTPGVPYRLDYSK